jgi:hypothetical protein
MKGWHKIAIVAVAIGAGVGVGYALVKRSENLSLFAEFRKLGDINGDGVIDDKDITLMQNALGSTATSPNWNPYADLNGDGVVGAKDLAILGANFGLTYQQWLKTKGYAKNYTGPNSVVPIKEI